MNLKQMRKDQILNHKPVLSLGLIIGLVIIVLLFTSKFAGPQDSEITSLKGLEPFDNDFVVAPADGAVVRSGEIVNLIIQEPLGKSFRNVFIDFLPFPGPEATTSPFVLPLFIPSDFTGPLTFLVSAETTDGSVNSDVCPWPLDKRSAVMPINRTG